MTPQARLIFRLLVSVGPMLLCTALAGMHLIGCTPIGALTYKLVGPDIQDAEHPLPTSKPTLLLVENYQRGNLQSPCDELAQFITAELQAHKAGMLVSQDELIRLRSDHPDEYNRMKIQEIGAKLHAVQVIYVNLKELSVAHLPASEMLQGRVDATVRVIDVATGKTIWPAIGADREFQDDTDFVPKADVDNVATMQSQIIQDLAQPIALLFYQSISKDQSKGK